MPDQIVQGTQEWMDIRRGKVTASRICDVMASLKSGEAKTRFQYRAQLACEIITGETAPSYQNEAMKYGIMNEPYARAAYEAQTGNITEQVGFIPHPKIEDAGASPDGINIGNPISLVEIKCPNMLTAVIFWLDGAIPRDYMLQMQWQMACCQAEYCDYVVFRPDLPENLRLHIVRVERDDKLIEEIEKAVVEFNADVKSTVAQLRSINCPQ